MSELKNSGNAMPFFFLFVVLAAIVGYGMANPAPVQHATAAHEEAGHSEDAGHNEAADHDDDSHESSETHEMEGDDSDAPAMDISHAPGDVHDSAGTLEGTTAAPIEPTMSNNQAAPKPNVEAHVNSEMDLPAEGARTPNTGKNTASETAPENP